MPPDGIIYLFVISFIGTPIVVETATCYNPTPEKVGAVCNWKEKKWVRKFDLSARKYYYTLEDDSQTDNFIEKKFRKRYLQKGKRYYVKPESNFGKNVSSKQYAQERGDEESSDSKVW